MEPMFVGAGRVFLDPGPVIQSAPAELVIFAIVLFMAILLHSLSPKG